MELLCRGTANDVSRALDDMGIITETNSVALAAEHGRGMFDTAGKIDMFSDESPLKKAKITNFPKDFFLILRVVQLFRGLASHMDIEFSTAKQWEPVAQRALKEKASPVAEPIRQGKFYGM